MLGCLFTPIKYIVKAFVWFFLVTFPLQLCLVAFALGGTLANGIWGKNYSTETLEQEYLVTVRIHWQNGNEDTVLTVRSDMHWTTSEDRRGEDLFRTDGGYDTDDTMPHIPSRYGYRFEGLWTSPEGGNMVVSPGGYSVFNLTENMDLYAVWTPIPDAACPAATTPTLSAGTAPVACALS